MNSTITIHHIHEWRSGHADPLARIERITTNMVDIAQRLTDSVSALALAISNQGSALGEVASAIRNHPASTTDNGKLSALADQIDQIAATVTSSTTELQQLKVEEDSEDAPASEPPATEPPVTDPAAGDGSAGTGDAQPPATDPAAGGDAGGAPATDPAAGDAGAPLGDGTTSDAGSAGGGDVGSADGTQPDTDTGAGE